MGGTNKPSNRISFVWLTSTMLAGCLVFALGMNEPGTRWTAFAIGVWSGAALYLVSFAFSAFLRPGAAANGSAQRSAQKSAKRTARLLDREARKQASQRAYGFADATPTVERRPMPVWVLYVLAGLAVTIVRWIATAVLGEELILTATVVFFGLFVGVVMPMAHVIVAAIRTPQRKPPPPKAPLEPTDDTHRLILAPSELAPDQRSGTPNT